ncbi:MAG: Hsp20/alpha crystallin family protein [Acidobacteriaceae bacterium]
MAISRWTPFQEMYALQNSLNSLLRDSGRAEDESLSSSAFVPPVDIYEDANHIVLKLEVPGMKLEDFDIQLENNTLTVRGERRFEKETKEENYHRVERRYGSFARVFTLPNTLDQESVKAHYDAGVLAIELGKRAEAKPKQIKVSVSGAHGGAGQKAVEAGKSAESSKSEPKHAESKPAA